MAPAPMAYYPSVAGPNAPAIDATLDISSTVLATLTTAAQFAPLPFLQEASFLALAILTTVRGAKDNKEAFKSLANDACELVSAIICVYNDMEKDGQKPSLGLKKHVEDLIGLLQVINNFAQKHASKGTMYRMVRLTSETQKIQQYRARLRQALDVFGVTSRYTRPSSKSSKNSVNENHHRARTRKATIQGHRPRRVRRQAIHLATCYRETFLATSRLTTLRATKSSIPQTTIRLLWIRTIIRTIVPRIRDGGTRMTRPL
ncbi:hypothetical protein DFH09DRAFT_1140466 [Mycena vulgaris]|nr:hypothetical protein DFH09DRAFT_1140466 [Mycena vulgaris]